MTRIVKYSAEMLGWQRPPGPVRVWRLIEGSKRNEDGTIPRFSIQEIPKDRWDDLLDLMCTKFLANEPICESLHFLDDPDAVNDFIKVWSLALQQGIAVGAFLVDEKNPRPTLVGANMALVECDAVAKTFESGIEFRADKFKKILKLMQGLEIEKNPRKVFGVDKYITAFGLCVDPRYHGHRLGYELLRARDDMSLVYDLQATSTVFSHPAAHKSAKMAGFEVLVEHDFVDVKNEDGTEMFPGINAKSIALMGKKFRHTPSAE